MGDNINPGNTAPGIGAHFMRDFIPASKGGKPRCGTVDDGKGVTSDPRYVGCPACRETFTPEERAAWEEQQRRYPSTTGG